MSRHGSQSLSRPRARLPTSLAEVGSAISAFDARSRLSEPGGAMAGFGANSGLSGPEAQWLVLPLLWLA